MQQTVLTSGLLLFTLLQVIQCLNPEAYGVGDGYQDIDFKAGYRRAREMREAALGKGSQGPKEEVMERTYQERYTVTVQPRGQSCFFLEDLEDGYVISIHYLVITTKGGEQMDISMNLKDSTGKMVVFQVLTVFIKLEFPLQNVRDEKKKTIL